MKKLLIAGVTILVVLIGAVIFLLSFDFNRAGKENVYVQITADGQIEETKLDSGEVMKRYVYTLTAYDEEGTPRDVEFSANKNLKRNAYLMLYVKDDTHVTSYDEVSFDDVPTAAQKALQK